MRILALFSFLFLGGCALLEDRDTRFKPSVQRNPITVTIKIEKDFSRFGDDVGAYAFCIKDHCYLTLPEVEMINDRHTWCTWGVMLGFAVYGKLNNEDKINICNGR